MKRVFAAMMAGVMLTGLLSGCGSKQEASTWEDQLGNKGTLRVGIAPNYPPYDTYDENGNVVGYDADFAAWISDYMGIEVDLIAADFNTIIAAVDAGTYDVGISCFSYSDERAEQVDFTDAYLETTQGILVLADSGIDTPEDLAGKTISAGQGNVGLDLCYEFQEEYEGIDVVVGDETGVSVETVKSGAIDAYIAEKAVCDAYANASDGKLKVLEEEYYPDSLHVIVKKGNTLLVDKLNEAIAAYRESSDSEDIFMEWFS